MIEEDFRRIRTVSHKMGYFSWTKQNSVKDRYWWGVLDSRGTVVEFSPLIGTIENGASVSQWKPSFLAWLAWGKHVP
ncbi:hypothetical protein [Rhizobium ruizarguesonis]|jgi:hypothetical protein|uniref:hypothetical protein n=1 Tax=Rhizobium ruizarguesonis TaxID=2081791 RepID=UPI001030ED32|nr:hypothetical protein [Rhizobium ruizarguesonis]